MADPQTPIPPPATKSPAAPPVPSAQELYDAIMREIEPELTTIVIPVLDELYAGESPEDAKSRKERYERAFTEYDRRYAEHMQQISGEVTVYRKAALKSFERDDRTKEAGDLQGLESAISKF